MGEYRKPSTKTRTPHIESDDAWEGKLMRMFTIQHYMCMQVSTKLRQKLSDQPIQTFGSALGGQMSVVALGLTVF